MDSLFPEDAPPAAHAPAPLAERMRPRTFDEFVGQGELLSPGKPLRESIERDLLQSIILWGPPGTGKTTLARIIADTTKARFVSFSAVLSGIKEIRDVMADAERLRRTTGRRLVDTSRVEQTIQRRALLYDKSGEEHYNLISALHKSMRNSDPDAAVYWLARMVEAGEDPLYIARRLVRFASEDIGNADPQALAIAVAAKDAVHFIGMPEGNTALAQAAIYLATAPKSNTIYAAYSAAAEDAHHDVAQPVPLHLRNAPTKLMKTLDYGKGYKYAHNEEDAVADMSCLPPALEGRRYYEPAGRGFEGEIKRRLDGWEEIKQRRRTTD